MAKYLIEDPATGLYLQYFTGLNSDHVWTDDPLKAWENSDPKEAAYFALGNGGGGVNRPFKIKRLVVSTRTVEAKPYTREEYWARTSRTGPLEAYSVPCPQCRAKRGQRCDIVDKHYPAGLVHGLRRRDFLLKEAAKAEKSGRPNPYAGQKP